MLRRPAAAALAAAWLFGAFGSAAGHGADQSMAVDPATAQPGQTISVTAHGLEPGASVELRLASGAGVLTLGRAAVDANGDLTVPIVLPAELPAGAYTVEAVAQAVTLRTAVTVQGPPIELDEDGGERDEEDPLLVPLPSGWGRGITGAGPSTPGTTAAPVAQVIPSGLEPGAVVWIAVAAGAILLASIAVLARTTRFRRR